MAVSHSSILIPLPSISTRVNARLANGSSTFNNSIQLGQHMNLELRKLCFKMVADKKHIKRKMPQLIKASAENSEIEIIPLSAAKTIKQFYICINDKKLRELDDYISDDCYLEDCSFPYAMEGENEVKQFFRQLATSMGQNVKFRIEHLCEDDELTAGVNWHLEWNKTQIPFTRGCSFYECSKKGDRLVIKKCLALIESPIKPGGIVLMMLKNVVSVFDEFPKAAEWFLTSPQVILQFLLTIYTRFLAPIINPVLAGYLKVWELIGRFFALALKTLLFILKNYFG